MSFQRTSFFMHLEDLWRRIIYCITLFFALTLISYHFSNLILDFLIKPLTNLENLKTNFIYTALSEGFFSHLKASLFAAFFLSYPLFSFHFWRFLSANLYPEERKQYTMLFISMPVLFYAGILLAYFGVCPLTWRFFLSFQSESPLLTLQFQAQLSDYLSLMLKLMTVFGLGFQLPILIIFLNAFQILSEKKLRSNRKYAFLIITIISAVLTPADFISPISLIIPSYLLYEIALFWIRFHKKKSTFKTEFVEKKF